MNGCALVVFLVDNEKFNEGTASSTVSCCHICINAATFERWPSWVSEERVPSMRE